MMVSTKIAHKIQRRICWSSFVFHPLKWRTDFRGWQKENGGWHTSLFWQLCKSRLAEIQKTRFLRFGERCCTGMAWRRSLLLWTERRKVHRLPRWFWYLHLRSQKSWDPGCGKSIAWSSGTSLTGAYRQSMASWFSYLCRKPCMLFCRTCWYQKSNEPVNN